ncbi:MAG TPA: hypothetical protein VM915_05250 [Verrucomicrobiae bacterium]|nr:hypothetical protein [Verrucomicrobiae bacterium]
MMRAISVAAALTLSACASTPADTFIGPPSLEVSADIPAPARARFYADCIRQSATSGDYFREESDDTLLRFNCEGDVAQRFFEGLGPYSAQVGSEMIVGTRTWRFTAPIRRNTIGLDYCWRDQPNENAEPVYECTVVLNVGAFLAAD